MFLSADTLALLMDSGLPPEKVLEIYRALERDFRAMEPLPQKSKAAIRTARWRAKASQNVTEASPCDGSESVTEASQNVTNRHGVTPLACVVDNPLSLDNSKVGVGGVVTGASEAPTDWPEGDARHWAEILVDAVSSAKLDPARSPLLITTAGQILLWKQAGASWLYDVVPVVTTVAKTGPPKIATWKFFTDAILRSIAENRQALKIPEAQSRERFDTPAAKQSARLANLSEGVAIAHQVADYRGRVAGAG